MVQTATTQLSFVEGLEFWRDHAASKAGAKNERIARDLRIVIAVLAADKGVSAESIRRPRRRKLQRLRQITIYITSVHFNHSPCQIARVLGLSKQVGTYSGRNIEEQRDDPVFDKWLDQIEARLGNGRQADRGN